MSLPYFTIYGERCSGTNFLENAILENFDVEVTWKYGWKHFFGFNNLENSDNTLFIGIIRNGFDWINSLRKNPYHLIPSINKSNESFLNSEIISKDENNIIILEDMNYKTNRYFKNIYELRYIKTDFLLNDMPKLVKNYILIRYEDLSSKYEEILNLFNNFFKKKTSMYKPITYYKKNKSLYYVPNNTIIISSDEFYNNPDYNLIEKQEKILGYI